MGAYNYRNTVVRGLDKVGEGMEFGPGPMDFTHDAINAHNAEIQTIRNKGNFDCATLGDSLEQAWSITINVQALTATDLVKKRILDFVRRTGSFANLQTLNSTDDVWLCNIEVVQRLQGRTQRYLLQKSDINYNFTVQNDRNIWVLSGTCRDGIAVS